MTTSQQAWFRPHSIHQEPGEYDGIVCSKVLLCSKVITAARHGTLWARLPARPHMYTMEWVSNMITGKDRIYTHTHTAYTYTHVCAFLTEA